MKLGGKIALGMYEVGRCYTLFRMRKNLRRRASVLDWTFPYVLQSAVI